MPGTIDGARISAIQREHVLTTQVLKNLETLRLDYLIAIGDDTLSYAARLDKAGSWDLPDSRE